MTHTPGPWSLYQQGDEYGCWGKGGTRVFSIRKGVEPMNEDARLIAEMLTLLRGITGPEGFEWNIMHWECAQTLLAKIEGKK